MSCVCGDEATVHAPPLLGCLRAIQPQHVFQSPHFVRVAERLTAALVAGTLQVQEQDQAIRTLRYLVEHHLAFIEAELGRS